MADANLNSDSSENVPSPDQIEVTERDIVFECPHCGGELVIDMDGAGVDVNCGLCGGALTVPPYDGPSLQFLQVATAKLAKAVQGARNATLKKFHFEGHSRDELKRRENELQRAILEGQAQTTEVKGHIHHATIQLHRYQLKLEVIQERQNELKIELNALLQALNQT